MLGLNGQKTRSSGPSPTTCEPRWLIRAVRQPTIAISHARRRGKPRVRLGGLRRFLIDARAALDRRWSDFVDDALAAAARDYGKHNCRAVPRADDHVARPAGAMEEVPCLERP